jgi:TonB family protein
MVFSDSQKIVERFGEYIENFQNVFSSHNIGFGTPEDFPAFARNLKSNQALQEDLSRLVKSLMERESGKVSLRIVLTIIAVASGGSEIARSELDASRPVNLVIDFLISAAGGTQIDPDHPDDLYPTAYLADEADEEDISYEGDHSILEMPSEQGLTTQHYAGFSLDTDSHEFRPHHAAGSSELNQSLARLELSTLEVKLYLDSIDQRISRMEPHLESFPALVSSTVAQATKTERDARQSATPAVAMQPSLDSDLPSPSIKEPSHHITRKRLIIWPVLAGLSIILAGVLLYRSYERNSTRAQIHSVATGVNLPASTAPESATTKSSTLSQGSSISSSTIHSAVTTPANTSDHPLRTISQKTLLNSKPATSNPSNSAIAASHTKSISTGSVDLATTKPLPPSSKTVSVSSGIMAANLISAPVPTYPKLARLTHVQGQVVLQAVVSKKGTVDHLNVIQGPRLLRGAAIDAVKTWRYRPYTINGRAVEAATIVTVEFNLKR